MRERFHGWWIVAIAAIAQPLGGGLVGTYQVLVTPLRSEFGLDRTEIGLGMTLFLLASSLTSATVGPIVDRGPLRAIMMSGVCVVVTGLAIVATAGRPWQLGLGVCVFAIGTSLYGPTPNQAMLVNWFASRRGRAVALAAMGLSVGAAVLPITTTWLEASLGWRGALAAIAGGVFLIVMPLLTQVVPRPEDIGQHPDGLPPGSARAASPTTREATARDILRDPNFWLVTVGFRLALGLATAGSVFVYPHLESLGLSRTEAALAPTLMAASAFATKPMVGMLAERIDPRAVVGGCLLVYGASWLLFATQTDFGPLMFAALVQGVGSATLSVMIPIFLGACFDRRSIGRASGLVSMVGLPFLLAGAPLLGAVAEATGGFRPGFLAMGGVTLVSALLLSLVRIPGAGPRTAST